MSWDQEMMVVVTVAHTDGASRDEVAATFEHALSCYDWSLNEMDGGAENEPQ